MADNESMYKRVNMAEGRASAAGPAGAARASGLTLALRSVGAPEKRMERVGRSGKEASDDGWRNFLPMASLRCGVGICLWHAIRCALGCRGGITKESSIPYTRQFQKSGDDTPPTHVAHIGASDDLKLVTPFDQNKP